TPPQIPGHSASTGLNITDTPYEQGV
ncbi:MAG: hypothetical protein V7646_5839, partial [Pseudonocardia sp.]